MSVIAVSLPARVNGHALAGENLRLHRKRDGRAERVCRACNIDRAGARLLAGRV